MIFRILFCCVYPWTKTSLHYFDIPLSYIVTTGWRRLSISLVKVSKSKTIQTNARKPKRLVQSNSVFTKHVSKLLKVKDLSFICSFCALRRKLPGVVLITSCLNGKFTLPFFIFYFWKLNSDLIHTNITLISSLSGWVGKRKLQKIQSECGTIQAK